MQRICQMLDWLQMQLWFDIDKDGDKDLVVSL